ncbi:ATP-grasp ribosomal peptide maturase [Thermopolyspora sp. NPDC052614]|uniref:ATP-grasp ribosomal peptide maturase n=1 Tax=Thermopolyspora sp. NPDC052614 TaxID=3155682 RepID=UPI0034391F81
MAAVLILTALEDITADLVIHVLNGRGIPVVRVDPVDIGPDLQFNARIGPDRQWAGRLRTPSRKVNLEEITAVYYRRPTPIRFPHLEAFGQQVHDFAVDEAKYGFNGLLWHLPNAVYVNPPFSSTRAEFKPAQLQVATQMGFQIPPTIITNDAAEARKFAFEHAPIVYKTFRGVPPSNDGYYGVIWTQRVDADCFDDSIAVTAHMFQAEIPKMADVRLTAIGPQIFAQRIETPDRALDWRSGDWDDLIHTPIKVPDTIATAVRSYLDHFDLVFGCFDFALVGDGTSPEHWIWMECNPNGQWGWLPDADDIAEAFADVLQGGLGSG